MGADPKTSSMIAATLLGPMLGGLFGSDGQERQSFSGTAVDPIKMLSQSHDLLSRLGQGLSDRAHTPISLPSAYVQQPGAYTGGGLPMPIGLTASDPALTNPSLMSLQGMGEFERLFQGLGNGQAPPQPPGNVTPPGLGNPDDPNNPANPIAPFSPDGPDFNAPNVPWWMSQNPTNGRDDPNHGNRVGVDEAHATSEGVPGLPGDALLRGSDLINGKDMGMGPQRPKLIRGADLLTEDASGGDDHGQALGAVQLLLHALQQQGGHGATA